jgi:hypothetical protein
MESRLEPPDESQGISVERAEGIKAFSGQLIEYY